MPRKILTLCLMFALLLGVNTAAADRVAQDSGDLFLVWLADGLRPGTYASTSQRGAVVYMNGEGEVLREVARVGANDIYVQPCTERATSPDGQHFAFYVGSAATGTLYIVSGRDDPVAITNVSPRACLGMGTFAWRSDSSAFAFINPTDGDNILSGELSVRPVSNPAEPTFTFASASSFHIVDGRIAVVEVFRDDSVRVHHGNIGDDLREVMRMYTDRDTCRYRASDVQIVNSGALAVMLGHTCGTGTNTFDLYAVDLATQTANRVIRGGTGRTNDSGSPVFTTQAATLGLMTTTTGDTVHIIYPEGILGNYSAMVRTVDLRDVTGTMQQQESVVMPRQPRETRSANPARSPNGRHLAMVRQTANIDTFLLTLDLNGRSAANPISIGNRGDRISALAFTPDSGLLVFIAGGVDGDANLLFTLRPGERDPNEIGRGNFVSPLVIAPNGNRALVMNQARVPGGNNPYLNLVAVDLRDGTTNTVFTGAEVIDGRIVRQQFAAPLSWRP